VNPSVWEEVVNVGQYVPGSTFISASQVYYVHCFAKSLKSMLYVTDKSGSAGASTLIVTVKNVVPLGDYPVIDTSPIVTHTTVNDGTTLPFNESQNYLDQATAPGLISTLLQVNYTLTGTRTWRFHHYLVGKM